MPFCFQQGSAEHRPCGQGAGLCPPGLGHLTPRGCLCVVVGVAGAVCPAPRLPQQSADPVLRSGRPAPALLPRLVQASVFLGRRLAWISTRTGLPRVTGFLQVWRVLDMPTGHFVLDRTCARCATWLDYEGVVESLLSQAGPGAGTFSDDTCGPRAGVTQERVEVT